MTHIALYFSGRIKGYEEGIENLKFLKEKYNIIFFCSLNLKEITSYEQLFFNILEIQNDRLNIEETIIPDNMKQLSSKPYCGIPKNIYSHLYHSSKCFELIETYQKKNKIIFDKIIKFRSDIISKTSLPIDFDTKNQTILIPDGNDHCGVNDQIAYGDYNVMKCYSYLFDYIDLYCNQMKRSFHPETLFLFHLQRNNISIQRFPFEYKLSNNRYI